MKRFLLMCVILLKINSGAKSQSTDTLCFPVPVIQKVLIAAQQKKVLDSLVLVYQSDIGILSSKVNLLEQKDRNNTDIKNTYETQISVLNKEVKRWKRRTRWTAVAGVLLTGLTTFILIK